MNPCRWNNNESSRCGREGRAITGRNRGVGDAKATVCYEWVRARQQHQGDGTEEG